MGVGGRSAGRRGWAAAVVAGLLATSAAGVAASAPAAAEDEAAESQLIGCDQAGTRIQVSVSSHLDPSCTYTAGIDVVASGVVLDCKGALVDGPGLPGRGIDVHTPIDVDMSGVTVRNCRVQGFVNGIRITRDGFRTLPPGGEFTNHLRDVVIEDTEIRNTRGVGIFVDGYTSGTTIRRTTITGAGSTGIYLEAGSKDNVVVDNVVHDNGFRENGPEGSLFSLAGQTFRFWGPGREGLAIDGSFGNVVTGNHFSGNSSGGIFLYTNCGEFWSSRPDRYYERRHGADDNLIEGNTFVGGRHGIWVGSRMGENIFPMECKDRIYSSGPLLAIALDKARRNTIRDNVFEDVTYGVRVEDDGTRVEGNRFEGPDATHHAVIVGTRLRGSLLGQPVRDTVVTGNVSNIVGNASPYRWVHGVVGMQARANRALGVDTPFCESPQLPHDTMIFVHAVALEDPNGPPAPKPDYTVPTLGALPACQVAGAPTAAPGAGEVAEGDDGTRTVLVPVTLSAPSPVPVSVNWSTHVVPDLAGQATPGEDYEAAHGVVRFAAGATSATVPVTVRGDTVPENDELVVVRFEQPSNATLGGFWGLGFATILEDDQPALLPGTATVAEGDDGSHVVEVPVVLSAPTTVEVRADWQTGYVPGGPAEQATPGVDYAPASGTLVFAPGTTVATIAVTVHGDVVPEPDEFVLVGLTSATNARIGGMFGLGAAWLTDDDG